MKSTLAIINLPDGSTVELEVVIWEHEGELEIRKAKNNE